MLKYSRIFLAFMFGFLMSGLAVAAGGDKAAKATGGEKSAQTAEDKKDIIETATAAGNFTTLANALTKADLIETLKGEGPYTVFAPTDAAFAQVPSESLDKLLADKEKLKSVLLYHVVPGKVLAADVTKLNDAASVQGAKIKIKVTDGKVMLNDSATVTQTDIMASNGVIHVIDAVILPPEVSLSH